MRRPAILLLVLLWAAPASAQVAVDSVLSSGAQNGASGVTFAFNNVAGNFLGVGCGSDTITISTITYNGVSLASTGGPGVAASGTQITAQWFSLYGPATGSHNIVVTMSAANDFSCHAVSLSGVDSGTPIGTTVCDGYSASGTTHNHNTTSQVNGLVLDVLALQLGGEPVTPDGGQTTQTGPTSDNATVTLTTTKAGAASVTTGYSWTNDFHRWAHCTVPVNPTAAPPPGAAHRLMLTGVGQ